MIARWTRWVGFFTIVLALSAIVNDVIISKQLHEMKTGGVDTHNLAVAASGQAAAEESAASAASDQAASMSSMAQIASGQLSSLHASVSAAQDAADAAQAQVAQMQTDQRPWVFATDIEPGGRVVLADGRYAIPLKFSIKNTGHLPAFFVVPKTAAAILAVGESTLALRNDVCDRFRRTNSRNAGDTIFADQVITHGGFTSDDYPTVDKSTWDSLGGSKLIVVYGCIDYQFPAKPGHHQSRFSFVVGRSKDQGPLARIGPLSDDPAEDDIRLMPVTIGGKAAPD
jgi:hypothetical protein